MLFPSFRAARGSCQTQQYDEGGMKQARTHPVLEKRKPRPLWTGVVDVYVIGLFELDKKSHLGIESGQLIGLDEDSPAPSPALTDEIASRPSLSLLGGGTEACPVSVNSSPAHHVAKGPNVQNDQEIWV